PPLRGGGRRPPRRRPPRAGLPPGRAEPAGRGRPGRAGALAGRRAAPRRLRRHGQPVERGGLVQALVGPPRPGQRGRGSGSAAARAGRLPRIAGVPPPPAGRLVPARAHARHRLSRLRPPLLRTASSAPFPSSGEPVPLSLLRTTRRPLPSPGRLAPPSL